MISCLMITRDDRLPQARRAMACFHRQTLQERELVVVHDGSPCFHDRLCDEARRYEGDVIRVHRQANVGLTLGAMRNVSLALARGELFCQWDDDDLYHPRRLEVQLEAMNAAGADCCFLTDQLHYFEPTGELFWDDWTVEGFPGSLIQGTILGRRGVVGEYEDLARGEDTGMVWRLAADGRPLTGISGQGFLYIYVFDGRNTWDLAHHAAISSWKRKTKESLLAAEPALRRHLADYALPWDEVFMPHESGAIVIKSGGRLNGGATC